MKSWNFAHLARALVVVCAAGLATAASALVASPSQAAAEDHCMIVLPANTVVRCFATADDAMRFAESVGAVGPSKGGAAVAQTIHSVAPAAGSLTLISVEYDLPGWLGSSRWVYGTNGPCTTTTADVDYQLSDWAPSTFDQKISSFKTYNNCWTKHYDLIGFGGYSVGYQGTEFWINLGIDNDTTAERWS